MANVTPTVKTTGMGTTGTTSYATASITPGANKLLIACVGYRRGGATPTAPTASGNGLTWTPIVTKVHRDGNQAFRIFAALTGASPSAGAVTFSFSETMQNAHWQITEWDFTNIVSVALAVPQGVGVDNANNTTSMNGSLGSAISKASHATYGGMFLVDVVGTGITPGDSETELADQTNNVTFNWRSQFQWKQGTDNNMAWGYANGGNNPVGCFVEIAAAPAGGGNPVMFQGGGVAVSG